MNPTRRKHRAGKRGKPKRGAATRRARAKNQPKRAAKKATKKARRNKVRSSAPTKAALRVAVRAKRARLSRGEQRIAGEQVLTNLAATRVLLGSRRVACYLPSDGEIDTSHIIEWMWRAHKNVFLPVLSRLTHDRLWFAPAKPGMELVSNRYGIPEPRVVARELVRARELDLILLPVVAFDNHGNRLGRGAGFYDRSLAFLRYRRFLRRPLLFGLAHDFQRAARLATDPWDVPLDGVITDHKVYYTIP